MINVAKCNKIPVNLAGNSLFYNYYLFNIRAFLTAGSPYQNIFQKINPRIALQNLLIVLVVTQTD